MYDIIGALVGVIIGLTISWAWMEISLRRHRKRLDRDTQNRAMLTTYPIPLEKRMTP